MRLWIGALAIGLFAEPLWACTQKDLDELRVEAQTLEDKTSPLGERLVQCPGIRDAAVQWYAFYQFMTQGAEVMKKVAKAAVVPTARTGPKNLQSIIVKAKQDDYQELLQKVDESALGFVDSPEAQLALARALLRNLQFERGRKAYLAYLRSVDEDLAVESEYLYTFIWEGKYPLAETEFRQAARSMPAEPLRGTTQRGIRLSRELQRHDSPTAEKVAQKGGTTYIRGKFITEYSLFDMKNKYRRHTGSLAYIGAVQVALAHHRIKTSVLDKKAVNATGIMVGKRWKLAEDTFFKANAGYFSPGEDHYMGDAALLWGVTKEWQLSGGYYRTPLALEYPLAIDNMDLMREAFWIGAHWGTWLEMRSELRRELGYATHEYHRIMGRYPIREGEDKDDYVGIRVPVSLEIHPKANPNYPSDPRTIRVGVGLDFSQRFQGQYLVRLETEYHLINAMYRGVRGQSQRLGKFQVGGELVMTRYADQEFFVKGFYSRAEEEEEFRIYDLMNFLAIGINWAT